VRYFVYAIRRFLKWAATLGDYCLACGEERIVFGKEIWGYFRMCPRCDKKWVDAHKDILL